MTHPMLRAVRPALDRPGYSLVEVVGLAPFTMADKKLRTYRRFCNVVAFRFDIEFGAMPQADWEALLERARREGGAS